MKKQLFSFLIISIFVLSISAQKDIEKTVDGIRRIHKEISQKIVATEKDEESGKYSRIAVDEYVTNKLNRSWEAVGTFNVVNRFYYQHRKEEPYPDQLIKITEKMQSAARTYFEEFVYDKSDTLIFYSRKVNENEDPPFERRIYFDEGKAIRIIEDKKTRDKLTKEDKAIVESVLGNSKKLRQRFAG